MKTPFIDLKTQYRELRSQIKARMDAVLEHGQYIMGPEVRELEEALEQYLATSHCITVASGTEALLISLMALDVGPGDEIITSPFTFVATAEVIVLLGAKPVFVDIERDTCNIDASLIERAITPRTKAILPVSLYGQTADMESINILAAKHGGIPVIEDAAQSFGAVFKGLKSCSLSTIGCTSFFPSKPLGCYGDGGAIFTDDSEIAMACREIRVHGQSERYVHTRVGVGGRMDTLQCAIVLAKFAKFDWEVEQRQLIGNRYSQLIKQLPDECGVRPIVLRQDRTSVYGQYTVVCEDRDEMRDRLESKGYPTAIHYPLPLNQQAAYEHLCCPTCTPNSQWAAAHVLSLPMHPYMEESAQNAIVEAMRP